MEVIVYSCAYMDTDSFVYHIKTEDFYKDIAGDVEKRFDTSNYSEEDKRLLTTGLNKKKIGLMKDELGGKIMTEFVALRAKLYHVQDAREQRREEEVQGDQKVRGEKDANFRRLQEVSRRLARTYTEVRCSSRIKTMRSIQAKVKKIALNRDDDKRLVQGRSDINVSERTL